MYGIMESSLLQVQVLFQEECGDGVKNCAVDDYAPNGHQQTHMNRHGGRGVPVGEEAIEHIQLVRADYQQGARELQSKLNPEEPDHRPQQLVVRLAVPCRQGGVELEGEGHQGQNIKTANSAR